MADGTVVRQEEEEEEEKRGMMIRCRSRHRNSVRAGHQTGGKNAFRFQTATRTTVGANRSDRFFSRYPSLLVYELNLEKEKE